MIEIDTETYEKLEVLSSALESKLKKKGIVIPSTNKDGSTQIGRYTIKRTIGGYTILNSYNEIIVDSLNLPQTAVIMANQLALGRCIDKNLLHSDRYFGFAEFEEKLNLKLSRKSRDDHQRTSLFQTKSFIKRQQKERCRKQVQIQFEKLLDSYK